MTQTTTSESVERIAGVVTQIVVPVDLTVESWRALPFARELASTLGGVPIRNVFIDVQPGVPTVQTPPPVIVHAAVEGGPAVVEVLPGDDVVTALCEVTGQRADVAVVMASHGRSGFGWMVHGNVCHDLIKDHQGPVIVVGPCYDAPRHSTIRRVVCAVDAASPHQASVNECLSFADALGVPLVLIAVRGHGLTRPSELQHNEVMAKIFADLSPARVPVTAEILDDRYVVSAIVHFASRESGTLLALSPGAGRSEAYPLAESVAMEVLRHSPMPVLLRWAREEISSQGGGR
jgi:nucleotide-binding universal stress UspA family protein